MPPNVLQRPGAPTLKFRAKELIYHIVEIAEVLAFGGCFPSLHIACLQSGKVDAIPVLEDDICDLVPVPGNSTSAISVGGDEREPMVAKLRRWDLATRNCSLTTFRGYEVWALFALDNDRLAMGCSDGCIRIVSHDLQYQVVKVLAHDSTVPPDSEASRVENIVHAIHGDALLSKDSSRSVFVTGSKRGTLHVWFSKVPRHAAQLYVVPGYFSVSAVSVNDTHIAASSYNDKCYVFLRKDQDVARGGFVDGVGSDSYPLAFVVDHRNAVKWTHLNFGHVLTASDDGTVRLTNLESKNPVWEADLNHEGSSVSPSDARILKDGRVAVAVLETFQPSAVCIPKSVKTTEPKPTESFEIRVFDAPSALNVPKPLADGQPRNDGGVSLGVPFVTGKASRQKNAVTGGGHAASDLAGVAANQGKESPAARDAEGPSSSGGSRLKASTGKGTPARRGRGRPPPQPARRGRPRTTRLSRRVPSSTPSSEVIIDISSDEEAGEAGESSAPSPTGRLSDGERNGKEGVSRSGHLWAPEEDALTDTLVKQYGDSPDWVAIAENPAWNKYPWKRTPLAIRKRVMKRRASSRVAASLQSMQADRNGTAPSASDVVLNGKTRLRRVSQRGSQDVESGAMDENSVLPASSSKLDNVEMDASVREANPPSEREQFGGRSELVLSGTGSVSGEEAAMGELKFWSHTEMTRDRVRSLKQSRLAACLVAYMCECDADRFPEFRSLLGPILDAFRINSIQVATLDGPFRLPEEELVSIIQDSLKQQVGLWKHGYRSSIGGFFYRFFNPKSS